MRYLLLFFVGCSLFHHTPEHGTGSPKDIQVLLGHLNHGRPFHTLIHEPAVNFHPALYLNAKYLEANERVSAACSRYQWLVNHSRLSPIYELSRLSILQTCDGIDLKKFQRKHPLPSWPSWLKESYLRTIIQKSQGDVDAKFYYELSFFEKTQALKIEQLQKALELSPENKSFQKELEKVAPRFIKNPKHSELFSVARDYEQIRQFDLARSIYRGLIQNKESELTLILNSYERIAQSFRVERNREVYWKELDNISGELYTLALEYKNQDAEKAYIDNRITKARAVWTAHQRANGQEILNRYLNHLMTTPEQKAQINFILGSMELETNQYARAIYYFNEGLKFSITDRRLLEQLLWSRAWGYYQQKKYSSAIKSFEEGLTKLKDTSFTSKSLFWMARSYEKQKKRNESTLLYRQIIESDPYSYYGFLSHLSTKYPVVPLKPIVITPPTTLADTFDWLIFLGEKEPAKHFLKELVANGEVQGSDALKAFFHAEIYDEAVFHFSRLQGQMDTNALRELIPFGYPHAYLEEFSIWGKTYKFPREIALSLTRQESAFNTYARSWADAFGLMQIIPELAQRLARTLNIDYNGPDSLYEAPFNIQMGVYYLSQLKEKYENIFPFYIAAYNAGENPVSNWHQNRYDGNIIEFIENIPYRETQNYVKLIFRNAVIYKMLDTSEPFTVDSLGLIK